MLMPMVRMMRIMCWNADEFAVLRRVIFHYYCAAVAGSNDSESISMSTPLPVPLPFVMLAVSDLFGDQFCFGSLQLSLPPHQFLLRLPPPKFFLFQPSMLFMSRKTLLVKMNVLFSSSLIRDFKILLLLRDNCSFEIDFAF